MVSRSFGSPDKDMCFLSILIKRLILISPQIQRLAIVSRILLGFDAARFAWYDGVTWHFDRLRALRSHNSANDRRAQVPLIGHTRRRSKNTDAAQGGSGRRLHARG
jgi:hypothetical protein